MSKKKTRIMGGAGVVMHSPQNATELRRMHDSLVERGFMPIAPHVESIHTGVEDAQSIRNLGRLSGGGLGAGMSDNPITRAGKHLMFDSTEGVAVPVQNCGTEGLGYVPWGKNNMLPAEIETQAASLPYTSAALKYLTDLACGLGLKFMYRYPRLTNGTVKTERIPYEDASLLFEGVDTPEARERMAAWRRTNKEVQRFVEANNLELFLQKAMYDDTHLDISYPMIGLSQGRDGRPWTPKVVSLDYVPATTARLEQMDDNRRINYVYRCDLWRTNGYSSPITPRDITAIPAIMPEHLLKDLRKITERHRNTPLRQRPTWFCLPTFTPSMLKNYYPQPAWWSIWPSGVFDYGCTIVYDKTQARKNATMWGKIMYINMNYMKSLYAQAKADTDEKRKAIRDSIYNSVNTFLQQRENNGKLMILDSWNEGAQLLKAVELVDVPQPTNSTAAASKTELQEIARIIFFALGVDPRLVGCDLGETSNGGTFQRELHLLKMQQIATRQRNILNVMNAIARFNGWDEHGEWVIQQQVLTTLDASKTGTKETTSQQ